MPASMFLDDSMLLRQILKLIMGEVIRTDHGRVRLTSLVHQGQFLEKAIEITTDTERLIIDRAELDGIPNDQ